MGPMSCVIRRRITVQLYNETAWRSIRIRNERDSGTNSRDKRFQQRNAASRQMSNQVAVRGREFPDKLFVAFEHYSKFADNVIQSVANSSTIQYKTRR
jgi:hypothetical protein